MRVDRQRRRGDVQLDEPLVHDLLQRGAHPGEGEQRVRAARPPDDVPEAVVVEREWCGFGSVLVLHSELTNADRQTTAQIQRARTTRRPQLVPRTLCRSVGFAPPATASSSSSFGRGSSLAARVSETHLLGVWP